MTKGSSAPIRLGLSSLVDFLDSSNYRTTWDTCFINENGFIRSNNDTHRGAAIAARALNII